MSAPGKKRGRPPKYTTDEERKAAKQKTKKESYQRQRDHQKNTPYQQEPQHQQDDITPMPGLQIQLDPLSILQQAGPEEDGPTTVPNQQIMAPDWAILAEENNEGADTKEGAQLQPTERVPVTALTQSPPPVRKPPLLQLAEWLEQEEDSIEDTDQVRETGETSGTVKVSPSGGWQGAFDDDSGDNIQPGSPLTDNNSLYSESVDGLGDEAGSIQLSDEADNIDWAAYSTSDCTDNASNSDDGPEDQQARQADFSEHTTDDENDGVDQDEYTRAAAAQLKMAWNKRCTCST